MLQFTAHGRLGRDPEQRHAGRTTVVNFSLAVSTGKDETTWLECAIWGNRGDLAMQYLHKGDAITVAGRAKLVVYTTNQGEQRQKLQLDVQDFTLPPRQQQEAAPQQRRAPAPAPQRWQEQQDNEELPF